MILIGVKNNQMEFKNGLLYVKSGKDEITIPLSQIVSVRMIKPGMMSNGVLYVITPGSKNLTKTHVTALEALMDTGAIAFTKSQLPQAERFKKALEYAIAQG